MKKKIVLISPDRQREKNEDFVFKMPFLNLPYLAAVTPDTYDVAIIDEEHEQIDFEIDASLIALSAQTPVAPRAYEIAKGWGWVGPMFLWNLNFGPVSGRHDEKAAFGIVRENWSMRPAFAALAHMPK